jgi:hypothetical protein
MEIARKNKANKKTSKYEKIPVDFEENINFEGVSLKVDRN